MPSEANLARYHPLAREIISLLDDHQIQYETFDHEPVLTSEQAAHIRDGYTLQQGAKAIVMRVRDKVDHAPYFIMVVVPGDQKIDSQKLRRYLKSKDIRFANVDEIAELTNGVQTGGIPPFGNLFGIEVLMDPTMTAHERIVFNAGDRCFSIGMARIDYEDLVQPKLVDLIKH